MSQETCGAIRQQFSMLLYGELSFDEEERVESHLDGCEDCRAELAREKALHAAFDSAEIEPAPALLRECREDLRSRLLQESAPRARSSWWESLFPAPWLRPAGAVALLAIGFLAARLTPLGSLGGAYQAMGLGVPAVQRVRTVEPAADGRVQIVLDETRQRVVSGGLDDSQIRNLLLAAAKDPSDPGLRAETVDILNQRAQSVEVRDVLIYALEHDQNAGVRLKAMEGLKPFARDPEVRGALSKVLLSDANPGLRTQAIDLLTGGSELSADRQIVNTLQELMERGEPQDYVRERSRKVLERVKASAEMY